MGNQLCDLVPLLGCWINPRWVVAGAVQDHRVATLRRSDRIKERASVQRSRIVGDPVVSSRRDARRLNDLRVIWPGWFAHPNLCAGSKSRHQVNSKAHSTSTARRVNHLYAVCSGGFNLSPCSANRAEEE